MARFRRVAGEQAGPQALGILVPPGRRTMIILRPRGLDWDLIPLRPGADAASPRPFWETDHQHAAAVAEKLGQALEQGESTAQAQPCGTAYVVGAEVGALPLVACERRPGQAYQPAQFASQEAAEAAARRVGAVLCPPAEANHELYLNTRQFSR